MDVGDLYNSIACSNGLRRTVVKDHFKFTMDDNDIIWMREYELVISNSNQIILTDSLSEMKINFETGRKVCTYISSSADYYR